MPEPTPEELETDRQGYIAAMREQGCDCEDLDAAVAAFIESSGGGPLEYQRIEVRFTHGQECPAFIAAKARSN